MNLRSAALIAAVVFSTLAAPSAHAFGIQILDQNAEAPDRYSWAPAYQHGYDASRNTEQSTTVDGSYSFRSNAVSFSLEYHC